MKNTSKKTNSVEMGISILVLFLLFSATILGIDSVISSSPSASTSEASGQLSQQEISDLQFMREEEKLAHDVYVFLYQKWQVPLFDKISQSEQRHTDAVARLINRYGLPDPALNTPPGVFRDQRLSTMYQDLINQGSISYMEALQVGGIIEDVDITDLDKALSNTATPAIIQVYQNLQRGSRNHLRSFAGALSQNGIAYQPHHLSPSRVQQILSTPRETGAPF